MENDCLNKYAYVHVVLRNIHDRKFAKYPACKKTGMQQIWYVRMRYAKKVMPINEFAKKLVR